MSGCAWFQSPAVAPTPVTEAAEDGPIEIDEGADLPTLRTTAEQLSWFLDSLDSDDARRYDVQVDLARVLYLVGEKDYAQSQLAYQQCVATHNGNSDEVCSAPTLNQERTGFLLWEVLAKYDGGPRGAEVSYYLGLITEPSQALMHLENVINRYYDSEFRPRACIALGNLHNEAGASEAATTAYQCAVESDQTQFSAYGRYRQAWVAMRAGQPADALVLLQFAVAQLAHASGEEARLKAACLDDMIVAFAGLPEPWVRIDGYYSSIEPTGGSLRLTQLAAHFLESGNNEAALDALRYMREAHTTDREVLDWGYLALETLHLSGDEEAISRGEADLVSFYGPAGRFMAYHALAQTRAHAAIFLAVLQSSNAHRERELAAESQRRRRRRR